MAKKFNIGKAVPNILAVGAGAVAAKMIDEKALATAMANVKPAIKGAIFLMGGGFLAATQKNPMIQNLGHGISAYGGLLIANDLMPGGGGGAETAGVANPYEISASPDEIFLEESVSGADDLALGSTDDDLALGDIGDDTDDDLDDDDDM